MVAIKSGAHLKYCVMKCVENNEDRISITSHRCHDTMSDVPSLTITHVATVRFGVVYKLPPPNRHHNLFTIMPDKVRKSKRAEAGEIQGFVLENGEFVDRKTAYKIAVKTGQFNRRAYDHYNGTELFSEDLW